MQAAEEKAPPGLRIQKQGGASAACRIPDMRHNQPQHRTRCIQVHGLECLRDLPHSRKNALLTTRTVASHILETAPAYPVRMPILSVFCISYLQFEFALENR